MIARNHRYIPPPHIPGDVYKGLSSNQTVLIMLALAGVSLAVIDMRSAEAVIPVLLLLVAFLYWKVFPENPQTVSISPTTVKADYGTGRVISDLLRNYVLHISTFSGRTVSSYTYTVSLKLKSGHARHANRLIAGPRFRRTAIITGTIPLCTRIIAVHLSAFWPLGPVAANPDSPSFLDLMMPHHGSEQATQP